MKIAMAEEAAKAEAKALPASEDDIPDDAGEEADVSSEE